MSTELLMTPISTDATFFITMSLLVGLFMGLWSVMIKNGW
ncbi:MAG: hypothetical protein NBKEAIPA_01284 [Nitrospirae bacterium]|mgnify:CR=1 FL=1|nr:MAG: hypothetical protein UZ03_NOB001001480 [Nitrospira sp. OLB3]MBV6469393.1 hypothetical protein [Nitrospirota bacterium]